MASTSNDHMPALPALNEVLPSVIVSRASGSLDLDVNLALATVNVDVDAARPEAGPLPLKHGEIGYKEEIDVREEEERDVTDSEQVLPARHPADRDHTPQSPEQRLTNVPLTPTAAGVPVAPISDNAHDSTSTHTSGKRSIISFFKPHKIPSFAGLRLTTLLLFCFQLAIVGATIAIWAISVMTLNKKNVNNSESDPGGLSMQGGSTNIFIHVIFAITLLGQFILLERRIYRLRAERYSYIHPGEMLPTSLRRTSSRPSMGIAPWNRPPLPTYATALAQSGLGTGDVEDNAIAIPPPPAYGNTRGSTLLLSGFLRQSLRAQRPNSGESHMSEAVSRPLSYVSRDDGWQEICDADRARRLEQTLERLEEGGRRPSRVSGGDSGEISGLSRQG